MMKTALFEQKTDASSMTISFRSFDLSNDISLIYEWVNQPYAHRFWQMNGTKEALIETYSAIMKNPYAHSYIGEVDSKPVCQIDLYNVFADELKNHIDAMPDDCGLHLLMCPPKLATKGLSCEMLKAFQQFYFSYPLHANLFAEPDSNNATANLLAKKAGFSFVKTAVLSSKTANIYCINKTNFL